METWRKELLARLTSPTLDAIGNYEIGKTLGEGTFGKVKLGRHMLTGQLVAIKIIDKMYAPAVVQEIEAMVGLQHPNIARFYEVLVSESKLYLVLEYFDGGDVFAYIDTRGKFADQGAEVVHLFKQIVEAMLYCHEREIVHRDLKLENILVNDSLVVKIIDFGFGKGKATKERLLDSFCGSVAYSAPEIIQKQRYIGPEADTWSLGIILYALVTGHLPFDDDHEPRLIQKIITLDYELPKDLSPLTQDLIQSMLRLRGGERLRLSEVLQHEWFGDDDSSSGYDTPVIQHTSSTTTPSYLSLAGDRMLARRPGFPAREDYDLADRLTGAGLLGDTLITSVELSRCDVFCGLWNSIRTSSLPEQVKELARARSAVEVNASRRGSLVLASPPIHSRRGSFGLVVGSMTSSPAHSRRGSLGLLIPPGPTPARETAPSPLMERRRMSDASSIFKGMMSKKSEFMLREDHELNGGGSDSPPKSPLGHEITALSTSADSVAEDEEEEDK